MHFGSGTSLTESPQPLRSEYAQRIASEDASMRPPKEVTRVEMASIFRFYRGQLDTTYWEMEANDRGSSPNFGNHLNKKAKAL